MILDGKKVRNELLEYYENKIKEENIKITLAIIYVGSDEPSKIYINNKIKYCEKVGIKTLLYEMDEKTIKVEVIKKVFPKVSLDGKNDAYVDAMFDIAKAQEVEHKDAIEENNKKMYDKKKVENKDNAELSIENIEDFVF